MISFIKDIRRRQYDLFGHIIWKEQIKHTVIGGTISGRRYRGKQQEKISDDLANWLGVKSTTEVINKAKDRKLKIRLGPGSPKRRDSTDR
jgi:hypothetical protein